MRDASHYGDGPFQAEVLPSNQALWTAETEFNASAPISNISVDVYANEGRWIAECPCGGAQLASHSDPRFMCNECGNRYLRGHWVRLVWPSNRAEIEALLHVRPVVNQNWRGESLADLISENREHGVSA